MHSATRKPSARYGDAVGSASRFVVEGVTGAARRAGPSERRFAPSKPNVLKQSGAGTFPLVRQAHDVHRGRVSWKVKFKALADRGPGRAGSSGGWKDGDNY